MRSSMSLTVGLVEGYLIMYFALEGRRLLAVSVHTPIANLRLLLVYIP